MRKLSTALVTAGLLAALGFGGMQAYADHHQAQEESAKVQLTDQQKNELAALHKDILAKKKEVIGKYVKFGVMSEEKGKHAVDRMEKRYEKLEQNGFIPKWDKHHKREKDEHRNP
ncbi:YckD family protein [Paenibacillus sp. MBLB4367]|uniref:YckD family protein n=1 Tax=Paenibacillus sp. MBLB4367 TaxID=3384767 RepID=UPI003908349F